MARIASLVFATALSVEVAVGAVVDSSWRIVIPEKEKSGVYAAIKEMAEVLNESFTEGADFTLPIAEGGQIASKGIYIGRGFAEQAGFKLDDFKAMDNAYAEKDGAIYCFGADRSGKPNVKNVAWRFMYLPSVKATTRFMRNVLGVRFLMPGKVGRDIPRFGTAELRAGAYDFERPAFDFAQAYKTDMAYGIANGVISCGGYHSFGGHTWPKAFTPEEIKAHPEYCALIGGRRIYGLGGHQGSLCISHPAVEQAIINVLLKKFDEGADVVQLAQMDGWNFCECEKCGLKGGLANSQAIANKLWAFHLGIAEKIRQLRPGKKVWIICYSATFDPPENIKRFPDNVIVELCHISEKQFARWRNIEVPGGFTAYIYLWGNYPFMGFTAKRSYAYNAEFVKMMLRNNVRGLYRCGYGELYGTEGPANCVFNAVIENPATNVSAVVEEYCQRAFGKAGASMRKFYDTLDKGLRGVNAWEQLNDTGAWAERAGDIEDPKPRNALDWIAHVYTADSMNKMESALAAAEAIAPKTGKIRQRLALVRAEWNYARNLGRIAHLYQAYLIAPSRNSLAPLLDELAARNAMIDSFYDEKGTMKPVPDWPEIGFFGKYEKGCTKPIVKTNGRLRATIGAPLNWDVEALRKSDALPGASRKTDRFPLVTGEIVFDDFDGGSWRNVKWRELGGVQGEKPTVKARFKLVADDKAIHIAAETEMADDLEVHAFDADGACWNDESFDLMIAPNGSRAKVYHLIWNPADGSRFDAAYGLAEDPLDPMYGKFNSEWNGNWTVRNERKDGKWRALVTIPYASIGTKGGAGSKWYFNLGRAANVRGKGADRKLVLWSPDLETGAFSSIDAMGYFRID